MAWGASHTCALRVPSHRACAYARIRMDAHGLAHGAAHVSILARVSSIHVCMPLYAHVCTAIRTRRNIYLCRERGGENKARDTRICVVMQLSAARAFPNDGNRNVYPFWGHGSARARGDFYSRRAAHINHCGFIRPVCDHRRLQCRCECCW